MKEVKDNFSSQAEKYAKYRPTYPKELYSFLLSLCNGKNSAWDCATGNGQVASVLAQHFDKVYATDISEEQIKNAGKKDNIFYSVQRSESTSFADNFFDLITVAQAIHWFDFDTFYKEVKRTIKSNGIFSIVGYGLLKTGDKTDDIIDHFYRHIIGAYWDKERKYIDENYTIIPFPFKEIEAPELTIDLEWSLDELLGYFETWSAVQHYIKANAQDPVKLVKKDIQEIWPAGSKKKIQFPVLLRVAKITK